MEINKVGYNYRHVGNFMINRPAGSGDRVAMVITSAALMRLRGEELHLSPGTVIIFDLGTPQYYGCDGGTFSNDWFHFSTSDTAFFERLGIPFDTPMTGFAVTALSEIIMRMASEENAAGKHCGEILEAYARIFFLSLSRLRSTSVHLMPPDELTNVRDAIFNMPYKNWDIDSLAKLAGYSRSYFQHRYKEAFGAPPLQDVIESKLNYARYLLVNTRTPIGEIAGLCGYGEPVHFMRLFKQKTGLTPAQYRKKYE